MPGEARFEGLRVAYNDVSNDYQFSMAPHSVRRLATINAECLTGNVRRQG